MGKICGISSTTAMVRTREISAGQIRKLDLVRTRQRSLADEDVFLRSLLATLSGESAAIKYEPRSQAAEALRAVGQLTANMERIEVRMEEMLGRCADNAGVQQAAIRVLADIPHQQSVQQQLFQEQRELEQQPQ